MLTKTMGSFLKKGKKWGSGAGRFHALIGKAVLMGDSSASCGLFGACPCQSLVAVVIVHPPPVLCLVL